MPPEVVLCCSSFDVSCCLLRYSEMMGYTVTFATRLATLLVLHAAGAGMASPTVLVTRPIARVAAEWLPNDNQTLYRLGEGERRNLELNTSSVSQGTVFITISPCSQNFHWALYHGSTAEGHLSLLKESTSQEMSVFSVAVSQYTKYVLQLSTTRGGAGVVSVRGEATRTVRIRLRVRSRRRLAANWEPSPIDPQDTTYCVVASHRKNYTSLCAAQSDVRSNRLNKLTRFTAPERFNSAPDRYDSAPNRFDSAASDRFDSAPDRFDLSANRFCNGSQSTEVDNKIDADIYNIYEGNFRNNFRRKKFGRSTKASDGDPVVACVGDRTHHLIENLDPNLNYFVSVFGVAKDRRAGSLLASGRVKPRTSTAKRLRENVPSKGDIRGKTVYYFKATLGTGGGLWMTVSTCGGAVDVEVLVRGKRLYMTKNIEPHSKFFVPAPIPTSSIQETSDEGSVQFDSSSEETKMRYVVKVIPCRSDRDGAVGVEITASTTRWGITIPEVSEDGAVRELRPRRSCKSIDVAFLPATHNATDVIRYCISVRENINSENYLCSPRLSSDKMQCEDHIQRPPKSVIIEKINGLKTATKYAIQVTAANKDSLVPYKVLYADTNFSCRDEPNL